MKWIKQHKDEDSEPDPKKKWRKLNSEKGEELSKLI